MLVDITFNPKQIDSLKKVSCEYPEFGTWEEMHENLAPWMFPGHEDCHPGVGQYCSLHLNFPEYAFIETESLNQHFLEFFDEQNEYVRNDAGEIAHNPSYLGPAYGLADNFGQILDYVKPYAETPDADYIIWASPHWHNPDNENSYGGFRPYKWGGYIGKYKDEIDSCEYYDDCEFPDDYQGYILSFQMIKIRERK